MSTANKKVYLGSTRHQAESTMDQIKACSVKKTKNKLWIHKYLLALKASQSSHKIMFVMKTIQLDLCEMLLPAGESWMTRENEDNFG